MNARVLPALALAGAIAFAPGCVQRRILVTSEPPGALVTLNDVQIGRTPVEAAFKFYGTYDVRLEFEGYQTLATGKTAWAPIYEYPVVDLAAIAAPFNLEKTVRWHFALEPSLETTVPEPQLLQDLGERARDLRASIVAEGASESAE